MTRYTFILTTRNGQPLGELHQARERSLTFTLSGTPTASFTLPMSDEFARRLSNPDNEHLVKVYAETITDISTYRTLVFHGPVVDVETTFGMNGSVRVNCAGPFWNLTHRYLGGKPDDASQPAYEDIPKNTVARDLIAKANAQGVTGVNHSGLGDGATASSVTIADMELKNVAEWITELGRGQLGAQTADGFDWGVIPTEYSGGYLGNFFTGSAGPDNIAAHLIGYKLENLVVFEMGEGTKNNLVEARQPVSRDGLANVVYHVKPEDAAGAVMVETDTSSISDRGRHEAVLRDDILDDTYRNQLIQSHLSVRKQPRRILEITPAPEDSGGRVPALWDEYRLGDRVGLRIVEWGEVVVDAMVRIYGIAVSIDDAGTPTHTLTIIPTS